MENGTEAPKRTVDCLNEDEGEISDAAQSTLTGLEYRKSLHFLRASSRSQSRSFSEQPRRDLTTDSLAPSTSVEEFRFEPERLNVWRLLLRTVQAIGLIYGDLGTSPLYTVSSLLNGGSTPDLLTIYASASLIFWLLVLVPSIKYAFLVAMADHNGEGGAFALLSLLRTGKCGRRLFQAAVLVALVGAGAFLADGTITPSITVVSAVQGFQVGIPSLPNAAVVGISIGILVGVFTSQWLGSSRLGVLYGPVLIVFFVVQFMLGIHGITQHPAIFKALNPYYALKGIGTRWPDGKIGFLKVADAMLATTGAEAMYADIGHFGKLPMRLGWFLVVLPSVLSTYLGQLAMVAADPSLVATDAQTLYFKQAPRALLWPLIVLTMVASVIASQAVISGTYSIVSQAMSLELLPRLHIKRTDWRIFGQVFIPEICIVMCVITVAITAGFQNSNALAAAYGTTVSTSFITTSVLFLLVLIDAWRKPVYWWLPYGAVYGLLDLFVWASTLTKFPSGGYIPFIMAFALILLMLLWSWGARREASYYQVQTKRWKEEHSQHAVDGLTLLSRRLYVFLTGIAAGVPYTYQAFVKKIGVVPKLGMFVTIRFVPVPFVDLQRRFSVREEAPGLYRIRIYIGYAQSIGSLPALIDEGAAQLPPSLLSDEMVFVMGRTTVLADLKRPVFRRLLVHCYAILKRFAVSPDADLGIPRDRIELGTPIEL